MALLLISIACKRACVRLHPVRESNHLPCKHVPCLTEADFCHVSASPVSSASPVCPTSVLANFTTPFNNSVASTIASVTVNGAWTNVANASVYSLGPASYSWIAKITFTVPAGPATMLSVVSVHFMF